MKPFTAKQAIGSLNGASRLFRIRVGEGRTLKIEYAARITQSNICFGRDCNVIPRCRTESMSPKV